MSIKVIGASVSVTTANTVNAAISVRAYASANTLISVHNEATVLIGTFIMPGNTVEVIRKNRTDTLTANVALQCTPVAT